MAASLIPAAQYLRMSTHQQQYSLDNQADATARYAVDHGFTAKLGSDTVKVPVTTAKRNALSGS